MNNAIQPYEPPEHKPNWGVIILTGFAALVLVISLGLLLRQASDAIDSMVNGDPTATLVPVPTTGLPVIALEVPHEGRWHIQVNQVTEAGLVTIYDASGTDDSFELPELESFNAEILGTFEIVITYPLHVPYEGITAAALPFYDMVGYLNALEAKYYVLYDQMGGVVTIQDERELNLTFSQLPREEWEPPIQITATPVATP